MKKVNPLSALEIETLYKDCVAQTELSDAYSEETRKEFVESLAERCNDEGIPHEAALFHIQDNYNYDDVEVISIVHEAYRNKPGKEKKSDKGPAAIDIVEKHLRNRYSFRYNQVTSRLEMKEAADNK